MDWMSSRTVGITGGQRVSAVTDKIVQLQSAQVPFLIFGGLRVFVGLRGSQCSYGLKKAKYCMNTVGVFAITNH